MTTRLSALTVHRLPGGASLLATLRLSHIFPVRSDVAACHPGAAPRNPVLVQPGQATRKRTLLFALSVLLLALPVSATVLVPADLGELSRDAIAIARGRVAALDAQWTEDHGTIETIVTLEVESYLKGGLGSTLRFRVPGGELGRFRSLVVGAPAFAVDQRVVVFLGARGPSVPYVLGLSQGVFRVARAADDSGWLVTSPVILPATGSATRIIRGDPSRRPLALGDFEQRVRALAGGAK
jgi:hypothetical protein